MLGRIFKRHFKLKEDDMSHMTLGDGMTLIVLVMFGVIGLMLVANKIFHLP